MDEIKENQHTCNLCEKVVFSFNLFHPADWLPFDTLNSELRVKFKNKYSALQQTNSSPYATCGISSCLFWDTHDVRK
jgi:hypothetical protein